MSIAQVVRDEIKSYQGTDFQYQMSNTAWLIKLDTEAELIESTLETRYPSSDLFKVTIYRIREGEEFVWFKISENSLDEDQVTIEEVYPKETIIINYIVIDPK
ncbi:hypothetical protein CEW46_29160 [Bacillus cereus]|nr:hypothetical protein CEW46_29160 [Bacillus cereus]